MDQQKGKLSTIEHFKMGNTEMTLHTIEERYSGADVHK